MMMTMMMMALDSIDIWNVAPAVHLKCSMHFSFELLCPADPTVSNDNAENNLCDDE